MKSRRFLRVARVLNLRNRPCGEVLRMELPNRYEVGAHSERVTASGVKDDPPKKCAVRCPPQPQRGLTAPRKAPLADDWLTISKTDSEKSVLRGVFYHRESCCQSVFLVNTTRIHEIPSPPRSSDIGCLAQRTTGNSARADSPLFHLAFRRGGGVLSTGTRVFFTFRPISFLRTRAQ
jgi:hypothetical protein